MLKTKYGVMGIIVCLLVIICGCNPSAKDKSNPVDEDWEVITVKPATRSDAIADNKKEGEVLPVKPADVILNIDVDGNGLYDDSERKAMLDVLQEECPVLKADYDADGDGKVTILEQTQGRDPITVRIPKSFLQNTKKLPWAINMFPEWLSTAYIQEDVAVGKVDEIVTRGTANRPATQSDVALQPSKTADGGIEFAANSGQYLSMVGMKEARWSYRWCVFTFRIDGASGNDNKTVLVDINQGNKPNQSSPKIWYDKQTGLNIHYLGKNKGGRDRRIMIADNVVADGKTWNTVVCGIRYGQMYAAVNGVLLSTVKEQPERFSGDWLNGTMYSYLGDKSKGNMAWACDVLVFGLTEPSEAMVAKMSGWGAHRLDAQSTLPANHPYKEQRPVMDKEDLPYRYVHNDEEWNAWGKTVDPYRHATKEEKEILKAQSKEERPDSEKLSNAGGERVAPEGFERVFYDDFRADRIKASTSGEQEVWGGIGFNSAVGASAQLVEPGREPNVYAHDAENKKQNLSLMKKGNRWYASAFYSVNDLGHGYTWNGAKIFRTRCMFPKVAKADLAGGLFPAFWSYGTEFLFWRTANRIECDWFEFDGQNPLWYNGMSSHLHYTHIKNIFAKRMERYNSYKGYNGMLTEERSNIPGGFYFWDGNFHTWEFVVDNDMTYVNVTIVDENGNDKWVEICRFKTPATYLERLDLQYDYALKSNHGNPKNGEQQDFIVDFVEVFQKTDYVNSLPDIFVARPELIGEAKVGSTITCNPHLDGINDIRYYWFADEYPITYGVKDSLVITEAEAGKNIRCMVKAVGALDMPEAWSK
jgi:hypothetical protein